MCMLDLEVAVERAAGVVPGHTPMCRVCLLV